MRPFFCYRADGALQRSGYNGQAFLQPQAWSLQGWPPVVGEGTAHCLAVALRRDGLGIGASLETTLDGSDTAYRFLALFLGTPIRFEEVACRFLEVVVLA